MVCNNLELMLLIHSFNRFYFFFHLFIYSQPSPPPTKQPKTNHIHNLEPYFVVLYGGTFFFLIFFSVFFHIYSIIHLTKWSLMRYMIPNLSFMYSSLKYVKKDNFNISNTRKERERQIKKNEQKLKLKLLYLCVYVCVQPFHWSENFTNH